MFFDRDLNGDRLPARTVCLTYDDGPGPHTLELANYLHAEGIDAAFFVIGGHAAGCTGLFRRLRTWGHLIGNHTHYHQALVAEAVAGGDVVGELTRTDAIIAEHVNGGVTWFRAPYGNWREKQSPAGAEDRPTSVVAERLNRSRCFPRHVGPVNWDINATDYDFWARGATAVECAAALVDKAIRIGRGIILMHDSSEDEALRRNNRTLQATQLIVPALKSRGFRFVRLDEIPQLASAVRVTEQVMLRTADGRGLACGADDLLGVADEPEVFGIAPLGDDRVALRAGSGLYLTALPDGGAVADGTTVGERQTLTLEAHGHEQVTLRSADGRRLAPEVLYVHRRFSH
jgi:peptidoglycan/xylan/chitin deacetylase (PgdA/CDA1 family)